MQRTSLCSSSRRRASRNRSATQEHSLRSYLRPLAVKFLGVSSERPVLHCSKIRRPALALASVLGASEGVDVSETVKPFLVRSLLLPTVSPEPLSPGLLNA